MSIPALGASRATFLSWTLLRAYSALFMCCRLMDDHALPLENLDLTGSPNGAVSYPPLIKSCYVGYCQRIISPDTSRFL